MKERLSRREQQRALDEAQEIIYEAYAAPTRRRAVALAREALRVSPDCADAYSLLADLAANTPAEAIALCRQAVAAGERALGDDFEQAYAGAFWGVLDTRPYMRARFDLALRLWRIGQHDEAIEHMHGLLRLNPEDNQGVRYVLLSCLIALGYDDDAEALYQRYAQDPTADWAYARALLDYRRHGASPAAEASLRAALQRNAHVPLYLLGRVEMPDTLPRYLGLGDEDEAVSYCHENLDVWQATPGALEWLASGVS